MSRDTSPPPSSDDSAVGSMTSNDNPRIANSQNDNQIISAEECLSACLSMRYNNTTLTSGSIRTNLSACFDDLDMRGYETKQDYLVNFISIGVNRDRTFIQRPVSILWPDSYEKMAQGLANLDAYLINTQLKERPIEWMIQNELTVTPNCKQCNEQMKLKFEEDTVRWQCQRTEACQNLYSPIRRPSFFVEYEQLGLMKILFTIYYWSTCTQLSLISPRLKIEPKLIDGIWRSIQNVCRTALEKTYPRFRLCNNPDSNSRTTANEPVELISIKINGVYVVCAKHPQSNRVRLGLFIPKVSQYTFAELTQSWFASGTRIKVCEKKFLNLTKHRADLNIEIVPRYEMTHTKGGSFNHESAFGYLICQLTHTFRDFDSTAVSRETLKLILAETEWREEFGTNPYDAFTNIIKHMSKYAEQSRCYYEPAQPSKENEDVHIENQYLFAEKYFYSFVEPVDSKGNVIRLFGRQENFDEQPLSVVTFSCHICQSRFESWYFSMHMVAHVEKNRKEDDMKEFMSKRIIECKHCFKKYPPEELTTHLELVRMDIQTMRFGCRICCQRFDDRSSFLKHMRMLHFEKEMPYRCPSCKFASSFQRELFIHFQEEHRHAFIILCPICLRSFTVAEPQNLNSDRQKKVSAKVYEHIMSHYVNAGNHNCDKCCLSFTSQANKTWHKQKHHNPLEVANVEKDVKLQPFIVTKEEEPHCVKALPQELYIPNKQPNVATDEQTLSHLIAGGLAAAKRSRKSASQDPCASNVTQPETDAAPKDSDEGADQSESVENLGSTNTQEGTIHVRGGTNAIRFLAGGEPSVANKQARHTDEFSSKKFIENLSKMMRSDGIVPNQSVILLPDGTPAKCAECREYVTVDHYVELITCSHCKHKTHCPRAALNHKGLIHPIFDRPKQKEPRDERAPALLMTPAKRPGKCADCLEYVTKGHISEEPIMCRQCKFKTHCKRAVDEHRQTRHKNVE